jgi:hypothetical protein
MQPFVRAPLLAVAFASLSGAAAAVDSTLSSSGFTGPGVTPNANLLGWGQFGFAYDRQVPGLANSSGHNFVAGFGLLPNLEVVGRVAANTMQTNCFIESCGIRDLSASFKAGIGLDRENRFRVALGATDIGGAATFFRSYYGVLTYSTDTIELNGGLARRSVGSSGKAQSPLNGPFASAAWQPLSWIRGHVEYTDGNAWAGLRLFAPASWLPEGWKAYVGANARLTSAEVTSRSWLSAGLTIPLYKVPPLARDRATAPLPQLSGTQQPLPAYEARVPPQVAQATPAAPVAPATTGPIPAPQPVSDAVLQDLAAQLRQRGLEDIWVGRMPDASVAVRANNATYNWNSVDAVGAALAAIGQALGDGRTAYRLVLTQRQLPLVAVTGQSDCLRQWISQREAACAAGELSTPGSFALDTLQRGADWVVRGVQPSWKTLRIAISPVLRTTVATELGVLDYSAGVNVGFLQPLWSGASVEWRVQHELAHSDDFAPGATLGSRAIRNGTERLAFTQTMRLPLERWIGGDEVRIRNWGLAATTAQVTVGRIGNHFDGVHAAARIEPGQGRHRFLLQGGVFHNSDPGSVPGEPTTAKPLLFGYRYNVTPTRTYLEATAGEFMNNDRGLQLGLRQWFGDVSVQAYVRRTKYPSSSAVNVAGLEITVPIGPRRDMNPSLFQVTGTPRFAHAIETKVGGSNNALAIGTGAFPPAPSLDAVYNSDRAGLVYFEDNLPRLRDAAR